MLERLVIAIELIAAALQQIASNSQGADAPDSATGGDAAPTRKRRTKAEIAADEAAAKAEADAAKEEKKVESKPVDKTVVDAKPAADKPAFDYEILKASVIELANSGAEGKSQAILILGKYGVRKAADAPAEKWEAMNKEMQAALAELKGGDDFA